MQPVIASGWLQSESPLDDKRAHSRRSGAQSRSSGIAVRATPDRVICVRPVGGQRLPDGVEEQDQYGDRQ
jgi:hypothetical protein